MKNQLNEANDSSVSIDGICDCHAHFIGSSDLYEREQTPGYNPPPATVREYRSDNKALGVNRIVCVQSRIYGFDHSCMLNQMKDWGRNARGIAVVPVDAGVKELEHLAENGIRGIRLYLDDPQSIYSWDDVARLDKTALEMGWHLEIRLNGNQLVDAYDDLSSLSSRVVLDHIARFTPPVQEADPSLNALLKLIEAGNCWVKLSAPYASSQAAAPNYDDVVPLVKRLVEFSPERMLWGSNWPHTTLEKPPSGQQLSKLAEIWMPDDKVRKRIQSTNPNEVYGFDL